MQEITKDLVLKALSTVLDPDLRRDLVSLNMIEDVTIEGKKVSFKIVLTTPACPLRDMIEKDARRAVSPLQVQKKFTLR